MENYRSSDVLGNTGTATTGDSIRPAGLSTTESFTNVPSGLEVESATFHMPVSATCSSTSTGVKAKMNDLATKGTETVNQWKQDLNDKYSEMKPVVMDKIDTMRTTTMERVAEVKSTVNERVADLKTTANQKMAELKVTANDKMTALRSDAEIKATEVQSDMRVNPMKWAGIAAGTGFGLGLIARIMDHRKHKHVRRQNVPQLVIIESSC
jgi:ElaB/YqjD/DUF883 family membrane-anchored ribosome-binding protein